MNTPEQDGTKRSRIVLRRILRVVLFMIPALIYLPTFGGNAAVPPGGGGFSDLLITHYPNSLYLKKSLLVDHQIPFWSTMIQSGAPFAANPLAGIFYLPGWLALLFPLPAGLSIVVAGHIIFGTWGMDKYLGQIGLKEGARYLGALSFGLLPKLAAHFGAGHVTLLYAISWTPWLFYCSEKDQRGWFSGVILGMIFLADPRWLVYAGIFWATYEIAHRQNIGRSGFQYFLKTGGIAILISAPLLIPLLEYVQLATRNALSSADMLHGSLPLPNLIGAIIPGSGGNTEWYFYAGGVLLALLGNQLFYSGTRKRNRFWLIWLGLSILLAVIPGVLAVDWLEHIPGLSLLRVPARSLFLTGFCLTVIGANALDDMANQNFQQAKHKLINFSIIILGLMMIGGVLFLADGQSMMLIWGFVFFTIAGFLLFIFPHVSWKKHWQWLIIALLIIDYLGAGLTAYEIQDQGLRKPEANLAAISEEEGYFRIYSPSYSVPQYLAAEYGLELADGVDPLQIASYVDFMQAATGVPQADYSVTIPPFRTGDPSQDNLSAEIDSQLLGLLNVRYVVSEFALQAPGLEPLSTDSMPKVYRNEAFLPRAWMETIDPASGQIISTDAAHPVILNKSANTILLEVSGPGKLVVSEVYYPGWQVYLDGEREEIKVSHDILRSVILPEGDHQVLFRFRPISVFAGLGLSVLGWVLIAIISIRNSFDKLSA